MKTAVSIPDDVFERAEQLARRLKRSRSEVYARALAEYVARHSPEPVTESLNLALAEIEPEDREAWRVAAGRILERTDW